MKNEQQQAQLKQLIAKINESESIDLLMRHGAASSHRALNKREKKLLISILNTRAVTPDKDAEIAITDEREPITREQFTELYAKNSGCSVEDLIRLNRVAVPCECGEEECRGWQMVNKTEGDLSAAAPTPANAGRGYDSLVDEIKVFENHIVDTTEMVPMGPADELYPVEERK